MTSAECKRALLRDLAQILSKDDDLIPDAVGDDGPEYQAWDDARNSLVREFQLRAKV